MPTATTRCLAPLFLALALALSFPAAASAACLQAANTHLDAQTSKAASVYVITKTQVKSGNTDDVWSTGPRYTYNKNGLLARTAATNETTTYKYSGTKLKSSHCDLRIGSNATPGDKNTKDATYTYDKSGRRSVRKETQSSVSNGQTSKYTSTHKYTYNKKGQVSKIVSTTSGSKQPTRRYFEKYDKLGNPTRYTASYNGEPKSSARTYTLRYSKRGDCTDSGTGVIHYDLTYDKKGRLVQKKTYGVDGYIGYEKYTYKKMTVPAGAVTAVNEQQHFLKNPYYGNNLIDL